MLGKDYDLASERLKRQIDRLLDQAEEVVFRVECMCLLDESLAISSELGMRPLMERVLSRREILRA